MRSLLLLSLAMLASICTAPGQTSNASLDEMMTSALQSLVYDSSARLESYRFSMQMEQKVDLVNLTSGSAQTLYTRSLGFGLANMTDRSMKLSLAALTYEEGDEQNTTATAIEEYLKNDTIYLKVDGNWAALKLPSVAEAWNRQNTMARQLTMFRQSRLSLIGSEVVGGQDCYKVRAEMDTRDVADQLSAEVASLVPAPGMNYTELFHNMSLDICYWIAKDTHLLKKTDVTESLMLTPKYLSLNASQSGDMEMRINSDVSLLFEGFNESVNIELPSQAMLAPSFPLGPIASSESVHAIDETMSMSENDNASVLPAS
jgi:hypothetical protein